MNGHEFVTATPRRDVPQLVARADAGPLNGSCAVGCRGGLHVQALAAVARDDLVGIQIGAQGPLLVRAAMAGPLDDRHAISDGSAIHVEALAAVLGRYAYRCVSELCYSRVRREGDKRRCQAENQAPVGTDRAAPHV